MDWPNVAATTAPPAPAPARLAQADAIRLCTPDQMADRDTVLAWDALAQRAATPNPFAESWYLLPALRLMAGEEVVHILRFDIGGDLAGVMPLVRAHRYYGRAIPHLAAWTHPNAFLGAPLVARGLERAFWAAVLNWADHHAGAGLFLHLADVPLTGPLHDALADVLAGQGRPAALVAQSERAMLQSDLSPDAYLEASLSGKKRKELRRQTARLSELGTLRVERHADATGLDAWSRDFLTLEAAGWKGAAGSALASQPATAALFTQALQGAAARGRLDRLALLLDGRPIAMLASFVTAPLAFSFKTAFDEAYARFSPGVLLQRENLQLLRRPGIAACDSCAAAGHPMIDHLWRERRPIGSLSIAIGGALRRGLFAPLSRMETGRWPTPRPFLPSPATPATRPEGGQS
ncbi:GNAT family N-acetyltransferase [Novosphingobium ovatum]|uniref:GNAT family N-acetyltransferase n=1 Tax=Novosphingobium ovatum TaxID=1908523 RepID=UPI0029FF1C89|nr:GNAT family N-acetyltransferase [Novosphingobium ovatum]